MIPAPNQSAVQTVLVSFLTAILPTGVPVVQAEINRVPEPNAEDFVSFYVLRRRRIETNIKNYADVAFIGSVNSGTLTVTSMLLGTILPGSILFGPNVPAGATIVSQLSGTTGGIGTYSLGPSTLSVASEKLAAGAVNVLQPTEITFQLDVHGPNSDDNAQTISTLFRDDVASEFFRGISALPGAPTSSTGVSPLYADDPRQLVFIDENQQMEVRYSIEALVQANQVVAVPQQFADQLTVGLFELA